MKCVVLAYHNMGCAGIEALRNAGFEISAVFTHRDNPNENIWFDSVAEYASSCGIPAFAPIHSLSLCNNLHCLMC